MSTLFSDESICFFLMFVEFPIEKKRFTRQDTVDFFWHRKIGKCIPKPILPSEYEMHGTVRQ
jgi:hypothetical protein